MLEPEEGKHRHSYLKRKRCLRYSADEIARTLNQLCRMRQETKSQEEIKKIALAYAQNVEAACTKSRAKISNEDYRAQIEIKTRTLCTALIKQMAPNVPVMRYQPQIAPQPLASYIGFSPRRANPQPPPVASIPQTKTTEQITEPAFRNRSIDSVSGMMDVKLTVSDRSSDDLFLSLGNDFSTVDCDDEMYLFTS